MKTIEDYGNDTANKMYMNKDFITDIDELEKWEYTKQVAIEAINTATYWISVDENEPECELEDEGIFFSKYLEIKVKGYVHPFIGFYVKANDDQFFDFIHKSVDDEIKQADVTHYRFIL